MAFFFSHPCPPLAFFSSSYPFPAFVRPAFNSFAQVLSRDDGPEYASRIARITDRFQETAIAAKGVEPGAALNRADDLPGLPGAERASLWEEFGLLCQRAVRTYVREPLTLRVRLGQAVVLGFFVAIFFYDLGNQIVDIKNRFGAIFIVIAGQLVPTALTLVLTCTDFGFRA